MQYKREHYQSQQGAGFGDERHRLMSTAICYPKRRTFPSSLRRGFSLIVGLQGVLTLSPLPASRYSVRVSRILGQESSLYKSEPTSCLVSTGVWFRRDNRLRKSLL